MPREDFKRNLNEVQDDVVKLGSMVAKAIFRSIDCLKNRDIEGSQKVIDEDDVIDDMTESIEDRCIDLIALEAPMASDLRGIISALYMSNELERMGDYAEGIAKVSLEIGNLPTLKPLIDIPMMADKAVNMVYQILKSYLDKDAESAYEVIKCDDEVDSLYDRVYRELLAYMIEDPSTVQRATYLLWVAHNLRRVSSRTTNIAERVIYLVTGSPIKKKF